MLKKTAPYAIKGAVWYQGEDDDAREWVDFYDESMKTMVACWRKLWGWQFPFFQVELAPFRGVGVTGAKKYDVLRHKQHKAARETENMYDVCILDAGEEFNIHPRHKKIVGERLGRIVMKHVYDDESLVADCPEFREAVREGNEITLSFDNRADYLKVRGCLRGALKVTINDEPVEYDADIDTDKLIIRGRFDNKKVRIEYCEANYVPAVLFNSEGNPVYGFTCEVDE